MPNEPSTTRAVVRQMFEQEFADCDGFELPAIARTIATRIEADPGLLKGFLAEALYTTVYDEGIAVLNRQRLNAFQVDQVLGILESAPTAPQRPWTPGGARRGGKRRGLQWLRHTEYVGDRHVKLVAMSYEQLQQARTIRKGRQDAEEPYIRLLDALHAAMEPGQCVADVFSVEQIDRLFEAVRAVQPVPATETPSTVRAAVAIPVAASSR